MKPANDKVVKEFLDQVMFGELNRLRELTAKLDQADADQIEKQRMKEKQQTEDPTEDIRRKLVAEVNAEPGSRQALEQQHGQAWDTTEMARDFRAIGFMAPFVVVQRKSDGAIGSLMFQHSPRFYFGFKED